MIQGGDPRRDSGGARATPCRARSRSRPLPGRCARGGEGGHRAGGHGRVAVLHRDRREGRATLPNDYALLRHGHEGPRRREEDRVVRADERRRRADQEGRRSTRSRSRAAARDHDDRRATSTTAALSGRRQVASAAERRRRPRTSSARVATGVDASPRRRRRRATLRRARGTSAVSSSMPTSVAAGRQQVDRALAAGGRPRCRGTGRPRGRCTSPSPTVYAPPRGSTIGSHSTVAPAPDAATHRAAAVRGEQRVEERRALEHRAQVQRRAVGEVDEPRRRARSRRCSASSASARCRTAERATLRAELREVAPRPARPTRSGCSNAAAVGSTTTSSAAARREQLGVEAAAAVAPLAAADERERPAALASLSHRGADAYGDGRPAAGERYRVGNLARYSPVTSASRQGRSADDRSSGSGVVGSGIMGSGIAEVAAKAGHRGGAAEPRADDAPTRWSPGSRSRSPSRSTGASSTPPSATPCSAGSARSPTSASSPTATSCSSRSSRTSPTKKHLFSELDRIVRDGAILATNTSTLPVVEMAMETGRPERVCGIHFFNPAPMMPLVEVVRAITTSRRDDRRGRARSPRRAARTPVAGEGPGRVHRERAAVPVPQQRGEAARRRRRDPRRHRRGDEGRLQLPDGPARAARPRRPRHEPRDPRGALRRVQGPELRAGAAAAPHGERRAARPQDAARASTTTGSSASDGRDRSQTGHAPMARPALGDPHVLGSLVGAGVERAVPDATSRRARPACRSPSTCRPRPATTPTTRSPAARSARSACRCRTSARCARCSRASRSTR